MEENNNAEKNIQDFENSLFQKEAIDNSDEKSNFLPNTNSISPYKDQEQSFIDEGSSNNIEVNLPDNQTEQLDLSGKAYAYTRRGEFTSELFKVEIGNLPKFISVPDLKKLFINKFTLKPQKLKIIRGGKDGKAQFAFATFNNEEERSKAIALGNGFIYKRKELRISKAKPMKDPSLQKEEEQERPAPVTYDHLNENELNELICNKVCPLWKLPYEKQLEIKEQNQRSFLDELMNEYRKLYKFLEPNAEMKEWLNENKEIFLYKIRYHNETVGYRNKCEFSIDRDGTLGFRVGTYKENSLKVIQPSLKCPILPSIMVSVLQDFQTFIKESGLAPFDNQTHEGYWRQLTVRLGKPGCMAIVQLHPQNLIEEDLINLKKAIIKHFQISGKVTSAYWDSYQRLESNKNRAPELLFGPPDIIETMRDGKLQFRISASSFFQINVPAAEICYNAIGELLRLKASDILLDICCGAGSIGIFLAQYVRFVYGVELNEQAVQDARVNANINQIFNVEFYSAQAETAITMLVNKANRNLQTPGEEKGEIVAVLDPPRAGLNKSIIKVLRNTKALQRILYVSCEPKFARQNLIDLCRPVSNTYTGRPFKLTSAMPVDMFPHSTQCELLLLFERTAEEAIMNNLTVKVEEI